MWEERQDLHVWLEMFWRLSYEAKWHGLLMPCLRQITIISGFLRILTLKVAHKISDLRQFLSTMLQLSVQIPLLSLSFLLIIQTMIPFPRDSRRCLWSPEMIRQEFLKKMQEKKYFQDHKCISFAVSRWTGFYDNCSMIDYQKNWLLSLRLLMSITNSSQSQ